VRLARPFRGGLAAGRIPGFVSGMPRYVHRVPVLTLRAAVPAERLDLGRDTAQTAGPAEVGAEPASHDGLRSSTGA
jgi:hypothetical protein